MTAREAWRDECAELFRLIASSLEAMADALETDDDILGAIAGMGIANHFPLLPQHVRHTFTEYLSDEEARGARSDELYLAQMYPAPAEDGEPHRKETETSAS